MGVTKDENWILRLICSECNQQLFKRVVIIGTDSGKRSGGHIFLNREILNKSCDMFRDTRIQIYYGTPDFLIAIIRLIIDNHGS